MKFILFAETSLLAAAKSRGVPGVKHSDCGWSKTA